MHSEWILDGSQPGRQVHVLAPAKINLFLRVIQRRSSGYHEIRSLMIPITLADILHISATSLPKGKEIILTCTDPTLPPGEDNLAIRAFYLLREAGYPLGKVAIHLEKVIPTGAGLGGGSSDAAAVLKGLDYLYQLNLSEKTLRTLSLRLGADIPFFFKEQACLVTGIGETLDSIEIPSTFSLVIAFPGYPISTAKVYQAIDSELTNPEAQVKMPASLGEGKGRWRLVNDLEIPVFAWYPSLRDMCNKLKGLGALEARMTGSGSSIFGIFGEETRAKAAVDALRTQAPEWRFFLARPLR